MTYADATSVGHENGSEQPLEIQEQVQLLIAEATDPANLAQGECLDFDRLCPSDHLRLCSGVDSSMVIFQGPMMIFLGCA